MTTLELYNLYESIIHRFDEGQIDQEEFEKEKKGIMNRVDELLDNIDDSVLIPLDDEDIDFTPEGPLFNGNEYIISDEGNNYFSFSKIFDFLMENTSDNMRIDKIAIASGAHYRLITDHYTGNNIETYWYK